MMVGQSLAELQARRARMRSEVAKLSTDSNKLTANIDHVIGPDTSLPVAGPPDDTQPDSPLDIASLLPLLAGRPGRRTIIIVEDQP